MTEITEKRLYNIKQWVKENFDENIVFSVAHFIWGRDPNSNWNRVYIENFTPNRVHVWIANTWIPKGSIKDWD